MSTIKIIHHLGSHKVLTFTLVLFLIFLLRYSPSLNMTLIKATDSQWKNQKLNVTGRNLKTTTTRHLQKADAHPLKHGRQVTNFNLMEETYGGKWKKFPEKYFSIANCTTEYANANQLEQDHPCVIHLIKRKYLRRPASRNLPYRMDKPAIVDPSDGQSEAILRLLRNQTNGFFIECGALDGEYLSNTLYMERTLAWEGILIEADQKAFSQLIARNRKAFSLPVCLSTKPYPIQVVFNASGWSGSFIMEEHRSKQMFYEEIRKSDQKNQETVYKVQCFPLYSILLAVGKTEIDFFGLDVEGSEFKVLKTIPWHKIDVKTLSVEWNHSPEGEAAITRLMETNNFVKFGHIEMAFSREVIYVKDFLSDFRQFEFD